LPTDIAEDALRKAFTRFGVIREVKVIRKNSQGQPLKDYCYGFVLMVESTSAHVAVAEMRENEHGWTVSFSKDKVSENDQQTRKGSSPTRPKKEKEPKKKDEKKEVKKTKPAEKPKKEKEREKEKEKKKEKSKEKKK
jgi:outer membrane biosynthesis protein TonB